MQANTQPLLFSPSAPRDVPLIEGVLFSDGSCPVNPGPHSACAFVLTIGARRIERHVELGPGTCNSAEFEGLIRGLEAALAAGVTKLEAYSDSTIVVNAVNRATPRKKSPAHLLALRARAVELMRRFPHGVEVRWISRNENTEADALSRGHHSNPGSWRRQLTTGATG